ncbi:hypothetical protein BC628DRAFT_1338288 [Trametes gibbosa]|nr:hypothetical protein BC628DRAFT_1338288 [Trametes gibbosa]
MLKTAVAVLLWYDSLVTWPDEYRRIWKRKFTGATVVYLVMRYSAVLERVSLCLQTFLWSSPDQICAGVTYLDEVLVIANYIAIGALTTLRVYGVWSRDWKPLLVALPLSLLQPAVLIGGPMYGCGYLVNGYDENMSRGWLTPSMPHVHSTNIAEKAASIAVAGLLLVFTWIKTFSIVKESYRVGFSAPVAGMLLRDGTIYFLVLIIFLIPPMITSVSSNVWIYVAPYFGPVFINITACRFMLHLRGLYFAGGGTGGEGRSTLRWSDVNFKGLSSTLVGNLGATLDISRDVRSHSPDDEDVSLEWLGSGFDDEWADEVPHYSSDPFTTGMKHPDRADALIGGEAGA